MKFLIAMMKHETNTFSPVPTPLARFGANGPFWGHEAYEAFKGTRTPMAAFIDLAELERAEIVTPVAADARPSGIVSADAYTKIADSICEAVTKGCDAIFLDMHGAMVTETTDDGEGTLLERIRMIAPNMPIAVALDLHANLTERMVKNSTAIVGYHTYPHVDMYDIGKQVGSIIIRTLKGEIKPVMAWGNCPLLAQTLRMDTSESPMREIMDLVQVYEQKECLAATVFGGFPLADILEAGVSTVIVTDDNAISAELICSNLLKEIWKQRENFIYYSEPLASSISSAKELKEGPVLLIDHADNCASGATQDSMAVVEEIMRQGISDVAVGAIYDPEAVQQMIVAGVGATLTIQLGGKTDMPSLGLKGTPLLVTGKVKMLFDGDFLPQKPTYSSAWTSLGLTAVLDTGNIQFVVISKHHEPWDLGLFRSVGIEPATKKYLLLKSRIYYRTGFLPIARHVIECAGVGVTSSDYRLFDFKKVRRPIFPLDDSL